MTPARFALALLFTTHFTTAETMESKLFLAQEGSARYDIVLGGEPSIASEQFAVIELREHLNQVIGAQRKQQERFSHRFVVEGKETKERNIYVGQTQFAREHGIRFEDLEPEEWIIKSVGEDLIITGGRTRGTLYGVYEFLERYAGIVWASREVTHTPINPNFSIPAEINLRGRPQIRNRGTHRMLYPFLLSYDQKYDEFLWMIRNRENQPHDLSISSSLPPFHHRFEPWDADRRWGNFEGAEDSPLIDWHRAYPLWRSDHFGYFKRTSGEMHNVFALLPPERWQRRYPEFYSFKDGKPMPRLSSSDAHRGDLNYSNTESRPILAEALKKHIDEVHAMNDLFAEPRQDIFFITQMDNNDFSDDPGTLRLLEKYGEHSGVMLEYVNEVAGLIAEDYPDVRIKTFAYVWSTEPPENIQIADNVIVQWCNWWGEPYGQPNLTESLVHPNNEKRADQLRRWGNISKQVGVWDYHFFPTNFPFSSVTRIEEDFLLYQEVGTDLLFIQMWESDGATIGPWVQRESFMELSRWLTLQLMIQPDADVAVLTNKFLNAYYGAGAPDMYGALGIMLEDQSQPRERLATLKPMTLDYLTPSFYSRLDQKFGHAQAAAESAGQADEVIRIQRERALLYHSLMIFWEELAAKLPANAVMPFDFDSIVNDFHDFGVIVTERTLNQAVQERPLRILRDRSEYYRIREWPEAAHGLNDSQRVDIPAWKFNPKSNWFLRKSRAFQPDPESNTGLAEVYFGDDVETMGDTLPIGIVGTDKQIEVDVAQLLGKGYQWLYAGRIQLPEQNQIWILNEKLRFDLDTGSISEKPDDNVYDVYVSLRLTKAEGQTKELAVERQVLTRVEPDEKNEEGNQR